MSYVGHGSEWQFSHENVLHISDFSTFKNTNLPMWLTIGCDFGPFDRLSDNIGMNAVLNQQGGAVAILTSARTVYSDRNAKLHSAYMRHGINSAIKTLRARGLATLEFAEGSRKNKVVCLTDEGRRFAEHYALPAVKAEQRAFGALEPWEQREIMRLVGKFSHVLNEECEAFKRQVAAENEADDKSEGETCDS